MATQALCAALVENIGNGNDADRVQKALSSAANEIESNTGHDVYTYGPKAHGWRCPELNKPSDVDDYLENNFSQALANAEDSGEITVIDQDVWILVDLADKYGYGDGGRKAQSGFSSETIHLGRAISMEGTWAINDPNELVRKVTKHNIGHCLNTWHNDGNYKREHIDNDYDRIYDVSPMAWSYIKVLDPDSGTFEADACNSGGGTMKDDEFDACRDSTSKPREISDGEFKEHCSDSDLDRHAFSYSYCEIEDMDSTISSRH